METLNTGKHATGGWCGIEEFAVVRSVTRPLDGSEAGVDLVLIQTSLLLSRELRQHVLLNKSSEVRVKTRGVFHLQKNFGKLLLAISAWEKRVPLATKDRERYRTGDKNNKDENSFKWNTNFSLGSFHRENETIFSEIPFIPENFQWDEPKRLVPVTSQPEFPEFFGKWKTTKVNSIFAAIQRPGH